MCAEPARRARLVAFALAAAFATLPPVVRAASAGEGIVLVDVDVSQLNNRGNPTGYAAGYLEFRVKNMQTGRKYASPPSSDHHPALLRLPAGTYCLHSVTLAFSEPLQYCRAPLFSVRAGAVSNIGRWRFGVSHDAGSYRLMAAFEDQERLTQQAIEHYPQLFEGE
jgi:hypothetical protein